MIRVERKEGRERERKGAWLWNGRRKERAFARARVCVFGRGRESTTEREREKREVCAFGLCVFICLRFDNPQNHTVYTTDMKYPRQSHTQ